MWYVQHPLLEVLAKAGRAKVLAALQHEKGPWTVRALARQTDLHATAVSRAIKEFANLGLVDHLQPGRDHHITLRNHPFLQALESPWPTPVDCARLCHRLLQAPVAWWRLPNERPLIDAPMRIAVMWEDEESFWDKAPELLDAVREAGWLVPELTPVNEWPAEPLWVSDEATIQ